MTKLEREEFFEQLFSVELLLSDAARYVRHLGQITGEVNYSQAYILIVDSLHEVEVQRKRMKSEVA
jgi:hypothetical protein